MTTSKNTENIQGHSPLSQVPSALFRAFTRRSDLTSSQTVARWMHEHFDFKSFGRSVVISVKLWAFDVSSSVSGPGYVEVSGVGEQACAEFKPHLKLIGSAETQTEPETNSSKPKVNPFRMPIVPEMNRSGKAAPGFVCDGISNRFGSTNCSLR